MKDTKTLEKKQLRGLEALKKQNGNVSAACQAINICRQTWYTWRNESQEFASRIEEIEESLLDRSESKLYELIEAGNIAAICFHLKCKGKHRGYIERSEVFTTTRQAGSFRPGEDDPQEYIERMIQA